MIRNYNGNVNRTAIRELRKMCDVNAENEQKRISELQDDTVDKEITMEDIVKEILELAEEIIEVRRIKKTDDIWVGIEPYKDEMEVSKDDLQLVILYKRYYGYKDFRDYGCLAYLGDGIERDEDDYLIFNYRSDGTAVVRGECRCSKISIDKILHIHKVVVKMAKAEGIEFTSEIDYDKISLA